MIAKMQPVDFQVTEPSNRDFGGKLASCRSDLDSARDNSASLSTVNRVWHSISIEISLASNFYSPMVSQQFGDVGEY